MTPSRQDENYASLPFVDMGEGVSVNIHWSPPSAQHGDSPRR